MKTEEAKSPSESQTWMDVERARTQRHPLRRANQLSRGGTTYLPVAYLSKIFDMPITWDGETGTVVLGIAPIIPEENLLQHLAEQWLVDGDYPKNSKGETYGPDSLELLLGYRPELIAATATNDVDGYIRLTDMEEFERLLIEDFAAISASGKPYTVPVYDLEGNVIGEFELNK